MAVVTARGIGMVVIARRAFTGAFRLVVNPPSRRERARLCGLGRRLRHDSTSLATGRRRHKTQFIRLARRRDRLVRHADHRGWLGPHLT